MTGQWVDGHDGGRRLFEAGAPSLDFAATAPGGLGDTGGELLATATTLDAWLAERHPQLTITPASEGDLRDARLLREAIDRLARARADHDPLEPDDIDTVNLYAASPDIPPALDGGRRQAGAGRIRVAQALSALARDAVEVLAADDADRIRRCAADDCRTVYRDTSRTGSRRWCSMQRCGNRAKVRAHRARTRTEAS
ncbi:ABATE domain-containing protein [Homoserinibacter sp. GY 40078]|uniref:CGNR zinc finger domain-containing protein n=1 Tax=Homoserinibacter sp. GY 40078 TaxID=2603275 RepID=UPI0011C8D0BD|nr:CGNR zinc finger domain-containing protein [Homoserinibacter sp. GY 40078]TXK19137.1 hypothetical protein FVQ89_04245 [Homoserinibacter sp. GY 40078]